MLITITMQQTAVISDYPPGLTMNDQVYFGLYQHAPQPIPIKAEQLTAGTKPLGGAARLPSIGPTAPWLLDGLSLGWGSQHFGA